MGGGVPGSRSNHTAAANTSLQRPYEPAVQIHSSANFRCAFPTKAFGQVCCMQPCKRLCVRIPRITTPAASSNPFHLYCSGLVIRAPTLNLNARCAWCIAWAAQVPLVRARQPIGQSSTQQCMISWPSQLLPRLSNILSSECRRSRAQRLSPRTRSFGSPLCDLKWQRRYRNVMKSALHFVFDRRGQFCMAIPRLQHSYETHEQISDTIRLDEGHRIAKKAECPQQLRGRLVARPAAPLTFAPSPKLSSCSSSPTMHEFVCILSFTHTESNQDAVGTASSSVRVESRHCPTPEALLHRRSVGSKQYSGWRHTVGTVIQEASCRSSGRFSSTGTSRVT